MKKFFLFLLCFFASAASADAAPERVGHWEAGALFSAAIPSDDELESAFQVSGNLAYNVNEWFAVGFSGGFQEHTVDAETIGAVTISEYDVTGVPLFLDLITRMPAQEKFQAYGVLGLGTVLWEIDSVTARSGAAAVTATSDVETEFAAKVGGGVDWFINNNWMINIEAAYVFSNPEASVTVTGISGTEDVELDYWTVGAGLKFVF